MAQARIRGIVPLGSAGNKEPWLRVLTYNILAQALIRREQYPTNGPIIKLANRFKVLKQELLEYKPDIVFMQEVDESKSDTWKEILKECGLECVFTYHPRKRHGLLVGWNTAKFNQLEWNVISYDEAKNLTTGDQDLDIPLQTATGNIGSIVTLECIHPAHLKKKFVIGTTHLYWHGEACYERSRQVTIFSHEILKMKARHNAESMIIGGDFNSAPWSPGYSFFKNNFHFDEKARAIITKSSRHHDFGRIDAPKEECLETQLKNSDDAVKKLLNATEGVKGPELISCYNVNGVEPKFTNWTDNFRDVIDYIFVTKDLEPVGLLELPTEKDLGAEPSSLPRERDGLAYPSDHLPLMALLA